MVGRVGLNAPDGGMSGMVGCGIGLFLRQRGKHDRNSHAIWAELMLKKGLEDNE